MAAQRASGGGLPGLPELGPVAGAEAREPFVILQGFSPDSLFGVRGLAACWQAGPVVIPTFWVSGLAPPLPPEAPPIPQRGCLGPLMPCWGLFAGLHAGLWCDGAPHGWCGGGDCVRPQTGSDPAALLLLGAAGSPRPRVAPLLRTNRGVVLRRLPCAPVSVQALFAEPKPCGGEAEVAPADLRTPGGPIPP